MRLVPQRADLQDESHLLRADRVLRRKSVRHRERRLRQHLELRHLPGHFGLSLGDVLLPTQDVYGVELRLQRQRRLRRDDHVPAVSRAGVSDYPSHGRPQSPQGRGRT